MRKSIYLFAALLCCLAAKAQTQFPSIDVQHYRFAIQLNDENDTIKGQAKIRIKFLKDVNAFQLNLAKTNSKGKGMLVSAVTEEDKSFSFSQEDDVINIKDEAKDNSTHSYTISYQGIPA